MRHFSLLILLCSLCGVCQAHPAATSAVLIDWQGSALHAELQLPQDQLQMANPDWPLLSEHQWADQSASLLSGYLQAHIHFYDGNSELSFTLQHSALTELDSQSYVVAHILVNLPDIANSPHLRLSDDAIFHRVRNHHIYVSVRSDFQQGIFPDEPRILGILKYKHADIDLSRSSPSLWLGVKSMFVHGIEHIAEGADHLFFLFCLLLPAPLLISASRWAGRRTLKQSLQQVFWLVSAFTLGHSLTLALGTFEILTFPSQVVETAVAVTILIAAWHVYRPIRWLSGVKMALLFGLIHGMAFSATLSGMGYDGLTRLLALLAFNLGIESLQLALVAISMPLLFLLAETALYRPLRVLGSIIAGIAAMSWMWVRISGESLAFASWADQFPQWGGWIYLALLCVALGSQLVKRFKLRQVIA